MEKKKNIIMRHKLLTLICLLAFIVIVALCYIFFSLFVGGNDPYGDRLKGINKVKISEKVLKEVGTFLEDKEDVVKASARIQGKIIYVHITVKDGVSKDASKRYASEVLGKFEDKKKKYYDFGFFVREEKDDGYVLTGTKNAKSEGIVWIKS